MWVIYLSNVGLISRVSVIYCLLLKTKVGKKKRKKKKRLVPCGSDLKKEKLTCKSRDDKFVIVTKLHVH
jgi:hypothetical protein